MVTSHVLAKTMKWPEAGHGTSRPSCSRFESEHALVKLFENLVDVDIDRRTSGLVRELDCSNGIADIVLFELRDQWEESISLKDVPPRWAYWLFCLPYPEAFTTDDAGHIGGATRRQTLAFLRLLVELGFCEETDRAGFWRKAFQPKPIVENFYAIEAKLRDWKRALLQAARYREYAAQSWVLLDDSSVRPALENLPQFERLNIGLASISRKQHVIAHYLPALASPKSELRYWQANAEVARRFMQDISDHLT